MFEALEESARKIQEQAPWNDGWIAVRVIIRYDYKNFNAEIGQRIHGIEMLLKPISLLEQARTFALSDQHRAFDLEDDFDHDDDAVAGGNRAEDTTRKIGAQVAQSTDTLQALLPDLVSTHNTMLNSFGRGLADGCSDKSELWLMLRTAAAKTPAEKRQISVFFGFLSSCAESDPSFYSATLDGLIRDEVLGKWFPIFQTTSNIDSRGVERLHEAFDLGNAPIDSFQCLAWGRAHESIGDEELAGLLKKFLSRVDGVNVVIEILRMRFHGRNRESPGRVPDLVAVARDALSMHTFGDKRRRRSNDDYVLAEIARECLNDKDGAYAAEQIGQHLAKAIGDHRIYAFDYPELLGSLAETQPTVFLDTFIGSNEVEDYQRKRMFSDDFDRRENPLNKIPVDVLLSWCKAEPVVRCALIASAIEACRKSEQTGKMEWNPLVYDIVALTPNLPAVLDNLADAVRPMSWSGSRADILESRLVLFEILHNHDNEEIRAWARSQYSDLLEEIRSGRQREGLRTANRNVAFE